VAYRIPGRDRVIRSQSRQKRMFASSAATHKYTVWLVARRAGEPGVPGSQRREEFLMTARSRRRPRRRTAAGCWPSTSPPALPPGAACSACTTATTSRTPSRARCVLLPAAEPARPARPPRPRPRAEDQPDLALEGGVPSLLAAAVRPARTRLTSHPVPAPGKGGRPAQSGAGTAPGTPGSTATREDENQTSLPKTGATRSVTYVILP
jgi:hypothetical protein